MKRFLLMTITIVSVISVNCLSAHAEETTSAKHHIELSLSDGTPIVDYGLIQGEPIGFVQQSVYDYATETGGRIKKWGFPPITASYYYQVLPWLQVGGEVSAVTCSVMNLYDPKTSNRVGHYYNHGIYLAAGVRFTFYKTDFVQLYSGLSLGARLNIQSTKLPEPYGSYSPHLESVGLTLHATAFGVRFGKKVYGLAELGYGYKGLLTVGIGTRF